MSEPSWNLLTPPFSLDGPYTAPSVGALRVLAEGRIGRERKKEEPLSLHVGVCMCLSPFLRLSLFPFQFEAKFSIAKQAVPLFLRYILQNPPSEPTNEPFEFKGNQIGMQQQQTIEPGNPQPL